MTPSWRAALSVVCVILLCSGCIRRESRDKTSEGEPAPSDFAAAEPVADPGEAMRIRELGLSRVREGKTREAIAEYEKALAQDPANARLYVELATLYQNNREYNKMVAICQKAAEKAPKDPKVRLHEVPTGQEPPIGIRRHRP